MGRIRIVLDSYEVRGVRSKRQGISDIQTRQEFRPCYPGHVVLVVVLKLVLKIKAEHDDEDENEDNSRTRTKFSFRST